MNKESLGYGLMTGAIVVIAVFAIISNNVIAGASIAKATPVPTVTIVFVPTPEASIEDQLNSLHGQLGGTVPNFAEYKASIAGAAPQSMAVPVGEPKQAKRPFELVTNGTVDTTTIQTPAGLVKCTKDAADHITFASQDTTWIKWFQSQDAMTQQNLYFACGVR